MASRPQYPERRARRCARLIGARSAIRARLAALASRPGVVGGKIHDTRIAAICLGHEVTELLSAARDFGLFPELVVPNPLAG
ncbi:hypothetical protein AB3X52_02845 [Nocardioides sp. DS6]|uniref:Uncharacterized protein n=1 Tax=Nocardioides eburneus TaxID=3231482 RepID=A0ABV3SVY7_9ACTN